MPSISGKTAAVAVGVSDLTMKPVSSNEQLAATALRRALETSGVKKQDIDGLVVTAGASKGVDYDRTAEVLGLDVQYMMQTWGHGRFTNPGLHAAAMAVHSGMAETVACVTVSAYAKRRSEHGAVGKGNPEAYRLGYGPHSENPVFGLIAPLGCAAMVWQKYISRYGYSPDDAADLVLAQREHALLNPDAAMKRPLTREEYLAEPFVVWPLRKFDCALPSDGAVAVIVTSAERARDLCEQPAYITGVQGNSAGRDEHSFAAPWLGVFQQTPTEPSVVNRPFEMAGIDRKDIASLQVYDAFLPQAIATLERFGFCEPGEGLGFTKGGRVRIGGELPLNTSGGHLSEAHCGGWTQVVEAIRQVQGVAGARQVPDTHHTMYAHSAGDCTIFSREVQ